MWHAAILDTKFYNDLQISLGLTLHHNPSGASEAQTEEREWRLSMMSTLYKSFFGYNPRQVRSQHPRHSTHDQVDDSQLFQIFCQSTTGRTYTFKVSPSTTIDDFKWMVRDRTGMPPDLQCIIYSGKILQDGATLADYAIPKEATLRIVGRLRGC